MLEDISEKPAWRRDPDSETETTSICHFTSSLSENTDMSDPKACFTQQEVCAEAGRQLEKNRGEGVGGGWGCKNRQRH